jgi:hypothetical protein
MPRLLPEVKIFILVLDGTIRNIALAGALIVATACER